MSVSRYQNRGAGYSMAVLGIALITAICAPFHDHLSDTTVALAMLLVVLFVATVWGSLPAMVASGLGILCFNFFFLPPLYTLTIADTQNWIALGAFLVTALTVGQLSARARRRASEAEAGRKEAQRAASETRMLARLSAVVAELGQQALRSDRYESVLEEAVTLVARTLDVEYCNVMEMLPGGEELLLRAGVGWKERQVGRATVKSRGSQSGYTVHSDRPVIVDDITAEARFVPLSKLLGVDAVSAMSVAIPTREGPYGALGVHSRGRRTFTGDEVNFLQAVANVLGAMIERRRVDEALRESEATLNTAQEVAHIGSWHLDVPRNQLTWSDEVFRMFGVPKGTTLTYEAFLGKVHPEDRGRVDQAWAEALHGAPYDIEHRVLVGDEVKWVRERARVEFDADKNAIGGVGSVQDITQRKLAEDALKRSADEIRDLYDHAPCGYHSLDEDGVFVRVNETELSWFGYTREEMIGKMKFSDLLTPEGSKLFQDQYPRFKAAGEIRDLEFDLVRRDGGILPVLVSATAIKDRDGKYLKSRSTLYDITARKRAEGEIRLLARLQAVVAELGQRALRGAPLSDVLDDAVTRIAQALDVEYCKVLELLPVGGALLLRSGVGWKPGYVGHATVGTGTESQAGYTLLSNEPVVVEDLSTEERFRGTSLLHDHGVQSGMSVVISTKEGPYGVLGALTRRRRPFTCDEINFLQAAANVLGSTVERGRAEARLLRINRTNRALSKCNEALIRATEESRLLQQMCEIVIEEAGYRLCWVGRAENDEAKSVTPVAQAGVEEGYLNTLNITWADSERGRGPTGTCIRTRQTVILKHIATDPRMLPWRAEALKRGYASSLAIPLLVDSTVLGAITIYAEEPEAFGAEEVKLLTELADDLAFGIGALQMRMERAKAEEALRVLNADLEQRVIARTADLEDANRLKDELIVRERAATAELQALREREMGIGFKIQQMLLLDQPPVDFPGLHVAALTIPSQRIDGDFYDFYRHENQCLDLIVADVMGKGVPAALLGAATKSHFLEALSHLMGMSRNGKLPEPKEIVTLAHVDMVQHLINLESFVTLCYVRFDLKERSLTLVDCGHTGVIHWRGATGLCEVLHGDNLPLGVREGEIYDQTTVSLAHGDTVLLYSDGVTEARDPSGELFGVDRLTQCVQQNSHLEPEALVEAIRKAAFAFSRSDVLADDLTCVAIRVTERQMPLSRSETEIRSDLKQLGRAREWVREVCRDRQGQLFDEESLAKLELAVTEACSNIMKHAYHGRADQRIHLEGEVFPGNVSIRLHYLGDPFDPSRVAPPMFDGSRDAGFGMYLISQSVDEMRHYRDERGRNCIALVKARK